MGCPFGVKYHFKFQGIPLAFLLIRTMTKLNRSKGLRGMSILLSTMIVVLFSVSCENHEVQRPNIILINIDDMGWRDLSILGSEYYETPNIDALAKQGMIFTNGYASAANCAPSRASLLSGKWPTRHGIYTVGNSERGKSQFRKLIPTKNETILSRDFTTIPEVLHSIGYKTCHAGKWHISENPLDRGFDVNIGGGSNGHPRSYYPPYQNVNLSPSNTSYYLTDLVMEKTIQFIQVTPSPFFLHYAPYAVHTPIQAVDSLLEKYQNKAPWNGQSNADYATMVENLDRNVGLLIKTLKKEEKFKHTLIIFTSDNGGLFGITQQQPLRAGKGSYYEGGIRVPFFFVLEGVIKPGIQNNIPITNLDLFPTILDFIEQESNQEFDGMSLVPIIKNTPATLDRPLYWHFPVYLQAYNVSNNENRDSLFRTRPGSVVRHGDWKLHHYFEDDGYELYNLKEDIGEEHNLVESHPEKVNELQRLLRQWRKITHAPIPYTLNPDYQQIN